MLKIVTKGRVAFFDYNFSDFADSIRTERLGTTAMSKASICQECVRSYI